MRAGCRSARDEDEGKIQERVGEGAGGQVPGPGEEHREYDAAREHGQEVRETEELDVAGGKEDRRDGDRDQCAAGKGFES